MSETTTQAQYRFDAQVLQDFMAQVFESFKMPEADALLAAEVLMYSDLRGIDSHGIARLKTYCHYLNEGSINPRPNMRVLNDRTSVARIDGDNGMGLVIAPRSFEIAMEKAQAHGSGWVSIQNSNHYGAAGYYAEQGLDKDLIGISMTNTSKVVAPLYGAERMLGTNPIAIGFPGKEEPPIVIDFATSTVSFGKVEIQMRKQEALPEGWAIRPDGKSALNPMDFMEGAALSPLGSEKIRGGHKGYGLAAMVDLLCGVLSGANWGPFVPTFAVGIPNVKEQVGKGIGHFMGAWDIGSFTDPNEFKESVDAWIRVMRGTQPLPDQEKVLIHGDPEREALGIRESKGIPLLEAVVNDLKEVSGERGVKLPLPLG